MLCLQMPKISRNLLPPSAVYKTFTLELEAVGQGKVWYLKAKKGKSSNRETRSACGRKESCMGSALK